MKIKKVFFTAILASATLGGVAFAASLQPITPGTVPNADNYGIEGNVQITEATGFLRILARVVQITYTVFFIIAIFIFLLVAFEYLISQGEPAAIKKAQDWLIYAAVAVVIALVAVAASAIIRSFIGDGRPSSTPQPNLPGQYQ